jgi:hypothetical protein
MLAEPFVRSIVSAVAGATRASRPSASGTTATRCAQCGSVDHSMLDVDCPLAPRVFA